MESPGEHSPDSAPLWSRHRRGDPDALGALMTQRDLDWIRRCARGLLGRRVRAEVDSGDVVQATMLNILMAARRRAFDWVQDRRTLNRLIATKVEQTILNAARRRNAAKRGGPDAEHVDGAVDEFAVSSEPSPDEILAARETAERLAVASSALPPRDRRILRLRVDKRLGYDVIGEMLGVSEDAARTAKKRAVKRLAEIARRLERRSS